MAARCAERKARLLAERAVEPVAYELGRELSRIVEAAQRELSA